MTNDDPMYLRHLEKALEAAELEIKGLEGELREQDKILAEMQEQLAPTRMGEPTFGERREQKVLGRKQSNGGAVGARARKT